MKKKLVTVLLASSMVATMLAGCGSGSGDGTEKAHLQRAAMAQLYVKLQAGDRSGMAGSCREVHR